MNFSDNADGFAGEMDCSNPAVNERGVNRFFNLIIFADESHDGLKDLLNFSVIGVFFTHNTD